MIIRRKKRKNKIRKKELEYEAVNYGPICIERSGREVKMSSDWNPKDFEEHIENIKAKRPEVRETIDNKIRELISLIERYDPFELLSTVSLCNTFTDPEEYKESTDERRECYIEYAQSVILGHDNLAFGSHASKETIDYFNELIAEIFDKIIWYFASEFSNGSNIEKDIRFNSLIRFLTVRGDSYAHHHIDLIKSVFTKHDSYLKKNYMLTTNEIIDGIQEIEIQITDNFNKYIPIVDKSNELHEIFQDFVGKEGGFDDLEDKLIEQYNSIPKVKIKRQDLAKLHDDLNEFPLIIKPNEKAPEKLLDLLSCTIGDNKKFASFQKSPNWPTNDSLIYDRPLIKNKGKYYCFIYTTLFRNIGNIIAKWIKNNDPHYHSITFQRTRSEYLERTTLQYFQKVLPDASVFEKLFYTIEVNGQVKRVETDGIILYDNNLFIIEAKSGNLSIAARRGGIKRIKSNVSDIVDNAYSQALRTKNFIDNEINPTFEYEDGSVAIVIDDKEKYENIFLINVTLEHLGHLSSQLNSLRSLNLIDGNLWPWCVFINDLRIITELIELSSEFLLFLQRRIRANDFPQFVAFDEMDFLMFYFEEGLFFEHSDIAKYNKYIPNGYTEKLDRFYNYKEGLVTSGTKPRLKVPSHYRELVRRIEMTKKLGHTKVGTLLLSLNTETQTQILANFKKIEEHSKKDGQDHDFTIFLEGGIGLMFYGSLNRSLDSWSKINRHCLLKMYQTKLSEWYLITIDFKNDGYYEIDFNIYSKNWEYDPNMESELQKFKSFKLESARASGRKFGRNEMCPCASGLKYKKCCGR